MYVCVCVREICAMPTLCIFFPSSTGVLFFLIVLNAFTHLFANSFIQQSLTKSYYVLYYIKDSKLLPFMLQMFFLVYSLPFNFVYGRF